MSVAWMVPDLESMTVLIGLQEGVVYGCSAKEMKLNLPAPVAMVAMI